MKNKPIKDSKTKARNNIKANLKKYMSRKEFCKICKNKSKYNCNNCPLNYDDIISVSDDDNLDL